MYKKFCIFVCFDLSPAIAGPEITLLSPSISSVFSKLFSTCFDLSPAIAGPEITLQAPVSAQYSPNCSPHVSYDTSWGNLIKSQQSFVIISFILITCYVRSSSDIFIRGS